MGSLRDFRRAYNELQRLYGAVPRTSDQKILLLHDRTIAEALKVVATLKDYTSREEKNATKVYHQARNTSLKGAQRMNTQINAKILHTLNQLLKINGQILKLQSEQFAMQNKEAKDTSSHYLGLKSALSNGLNKFEADYKLPRFSD